MSLNCLCSNRRDNVKSNDPGGGGVTSRWGPRESSGPWALPLACQQDAEAGMGCGVQPCVLNGTSPR